MFHSLDRPAKVGVLALAGVLIGAAAWVGYRHLNGQDVGFAIGGDRFPVDVAGAVRKPRVISARPEMLVLDAIEAAGGETPDADLGRINLAAELQPNTQLYIPVHGESAGEERLGPYASGYQAPPPGGSAGPGPAAADGKVNINTAGLAQLDTLPGIGPVKAQRIIDYRNAVGRFDRVDDLINVKGIGPKTLEQMRAHVSIN